MYYWILFLVLSVQGFFISTVFFLKNNERNRSSVWLALLVFLISLQLLFYGLGYGGYYRFASFLLGLPSMAPILYGPLIYFFCRENFTSIKLSVKDLIHLIPLLLFLLLTHHFIFSTISIKALMIEKSFLGSSTGHYFSGRSLLMAALLVGANIYYWTLSFLLMKNSKDDNSQKILFRNGLFFYSFYIIGLSVYRIMLFFGMNYDSIFCFSLKLFMGLAMYMIAYRFLSFDLDALSFKKIDKYRYSTLTESRKNEIWNKIDQYLTIEANYLKSDLKLSKISNDLDIPSNYISQVINERNEGGFNRLVNELRIEFSKSLLISGDLKIYAIALESGFGNKNTFNQEFKKIVGCTPSTFRDENGIKSQEL